ncbi:MAG: hypothetical protein J2P37_29495 [Ktedonobacteraceae bacterium]|nr:hypothetical protein [Ktedonobacteraceae bacterium]
MFVHECSYCLEVQLRPTQFRQRTASREGKGAKVCWLIREGLDTEQARKALFGLPAVRFRVVDEANPAQLVTPWTEPDNHLPSEHARVQVFGTVAYLKRYRRSKKLPAFETRTVAGPVFFDEIFSGQRRWYRPNVLGRKSGVWALRSDVSIYFAGRQQRG